MEYLSRLNDQQKEAVLHTEGPLLIIAGAGAGKTNTLTHRMFHLIKSGIRPSEILAITFTNKAAKEMRDRVVRLIREDKTLNLPLTFDEMPFVSTFHALGVRVLRAESRLLALPKHFTIADDDDSLGMIKEAIESAGLSPKQFEPRRMRNAISRQKGELVDVRGYAEGAGNEYFPRMLAMVWEKYEGIMRKRKSLDFDDLISETVRLLETYPDVRAHYRATWRFVHIDEYQDTNTAQYRLSLLLAGETKNICVVGDMDQCLPPDTQIETPNGRTSIEKIKRGDLVYSAAGHGATCTQPVQKVHRRIYSGDLVSIRTKRGARLSFTPGHVLFACLEPTSDVFYTYLMYRRDKGFRIGITQSLRIFTKRKKEIGLRTRANQEHADRVWILRVSKTRAQAQYWEQWLAFTYGIPMTVFHTNGRAMDMTPREVEKLFASIPTKERAKKLFHDTGLSFDYPHYSPQGTTHSDAERSRIKLRLTLCDDKRRSSVHPWGISRLSINTTSVALREKLIKEGFVPRKGKRNDWRLEITRLDYGEIERIATRIEKLDESISILRTAAITKSGRMSFQPAANLLPTMSVAYWRDGVFVKDIVTRVEKKSYHGSVYDLDVARTHNYVAESISVHNSIYAWRGADMRNIMNFERDFPGAKTVLLEENYRSTKNILDAANAIIQKNTERKEKNLFTRKTGGEKIGLYAAYNEEDEARFVAEKTRELLSNGTEPRNIAVLYRANFQSRVLEDAMLRADIPYQVLGVKFFARKEVKDVLSFVRAALNPDGSADIARAVNVPPRGIGKVTLAKMLAGQEETLPPTTREKIDGFRRILAEVREYALSRKPSETIAFIIKRSGMETVYKAGTDEDRERLENAYELAHLAEKYDGLAPEEGIMKLLEDAALASDQDSLSHERPEHKNAVRLMTVHASKGLEFPYVFVTGLEDGLFPHQGFADGDSADRAEEERRLFYVAVTRAERKLYLSFTSIRTIFGSRKVNIPSEFIADIPDELLEAEGGERTVSFD